MQKYPLTLLEKASQILKVSKSKLKKGLKAGSISGEKIEVNGKNKWFIHAYEMDNLLNSIIDYSNKIEEERTNVDNFAKIYESKFDFLPENKILFKDIIQEWHENFNSLKSISSNLKSRIENIELQNRHILDEITILKASIEHCQPKKQTSFMQRFMNFIFK